MEFHWLRLRATVHPTEDPAKVQRALRNASALPEDSFEERVVDTPLETFYGGVQHLLEVELKRNRECRQALAAMLAADRDAVLASLEERMDDDGVVYLRLEKQAALRGDLRVGRFDDPVSVRVKAQVHPSTRPGALRLWTEWLGTLSSPAL